MAGDYKCHHHLLMMAVAGEEEHFILYEVIVGDAWPNALLSYMLHSSGPIRSIPQTASTFSNAHFDGFFHIEGVLLCSFSLGSFVT